jgi:uncharacterized protein YbjT (DUF2867 family)
MDIVIAGGHGKIALRLERLLVERGDRVRALIRNPDHVADVEATGAEAVICDIEEEDDLAPFVEGAEAAVFAAGAGPGSGPERKKTVDLGGAVKLMATGVPRYVIVSSIGAHDPESAGGPMRPYLEAKAEADRRLMESGLDWTIVRPGSLNDDPGRGTVTITTEMGTRGPVTRDDVAAVVAESLQAPNAVGKAFVVVEGETPIAEAVAAL